MNATPYIDIHTHKRPTNAEGVISVQNIFAGDFNASGQEKYCSVGLHPWFIRPESPGSDLENVESAAQFKNVIAIGEAGLDRVTNSPMKLQKQIFEHHLKIAARHQKPVIVHAVKAFPDIVEVYKNTGLKVVLIFHGFNGNMQIAGQLLDHGFYLSFGESLFMENRKTAEVLREIPVEQVFLETDESVKHIGEMYRKAASIKGIKVEKLKQIIHRNFINCFGDIL